MKTQKTIAGKENVLNLWFYLVFSDACTFSMAEICRIWVLDTKLYAHAFKSIPVLLFFYLLLKNTAFENLNIYI